MYITHLSYVRNVVITRQIWSFPNSNSFFVIKPNQTTSKLLSQLKIAP